MMLRSLLIVCFFGLGYPGLLYAKNDKVCPTHLNCQAGNVYVTAPSESSVYVDGQYTGVKTPGLVSVSSGKHIISVGVESSRQYLRKEVLISEGFNQVSLTAQNLVKPTVWRALFVGVPTVEGVSRAGKCQTHFSQQDLDDAYDFFKFNLKEQIEPLSYNTVNWEIERRDLTLPAQLTYLPNNDWFTLEAEQGLAEFNDIGPGQYDTIFYFWREEQGNCSFKSSYFGLAWLDPLDMATKKTGYVTVKFNPGEIGVKAMLERYKANDPGVWTHEWLHVVIEQFYPNRHINVPIPPKDSLILHAAGAYRYQYPWMDWYKDLISGQVPLGKGYTGIGPETLLSCTIIKAGKGLC